MKKINNSKSPFRLIILAAILTMAACKTPSELIDKQEDLKVPENFNNAENDSINDGNVKWNEYFKDENLTKLIGEALKNNQELNITMQEIEVAKNNIGAKKGQYLPFVGLGAIGGAEKVGRYTSQGANDANTNIKGNQATPEFLPNYMVGAFASWQIDIWGKLHNAKKSALTRYLGTVEAKNFMVTNLIAEIANSYYELLALDNQLEILKQNIVIQTNALKIVRLQKVAARVTELAVRRFEAQVFSTRSTQFEVQQKIVQTENRINYLVGRFPAPIVRNHKGFVNLEPELVHSGIPAELLANRPDIKKAELDLVAAKLDVKVARANFYPSLNLTAGLGYSAFKTKFLFTTPKSMIYNLAGGLTAPLINRMAIKAAYHNSTARQIEAIYNYERTVINAYVEVVNNLAKIKNMQQSFGLKKQEVAALTQSISISNNLFKSARATYMEVLLTQRDALESRFELIETKKNQMNAFVNIYKSLGGGWK